MPVYVALLRAINVGGHNKVGMAALRQLAQELGHVEVQTYLQSGNLIFSSPSQDPDQLAKKLEQGISREFGLSITVLLRSGEQLARVVAANPFSPATERLYVTFLSAEPDPAGVAHLHALDAAPEELRVVNREVYLYLPSGAGRTRLTNTLLESRLKVRGTARNWRSVTSLCTLANPEVD